MAKRNVYLTEKQIETIKNHLLTENRESKNMSKARNLLYQQGYSQEDAQKTIEAIRNDIPNARLSDCKFLPGVTRMYLGGELSDGNTIMKLNKTLKYVASDVHVNEYDNNLNGLSVNELVQRFAGVQQQDADASRAESYGKEYARNTAYTIVRIPDAETAAKYGRYTSWCVTHDGDMYNSYTAGGTGLFYFCLRNGFENEQPNVGENCPLDSYGLSMIAVSVTMDGELNTCTCRWNHDNGGNDNIMNKNQIEELLGVNFYEVFKPYTREELHAKGVILFDEVPELLKKTTRLGEIFDYVYRNDNTFVTVGLNEKYNVVKEIDGGYELLSPNRWFYNINGFFNDEAGKESFVVETSENKYNALSVNGELLFEEDIANLGKVHDGWAVVGFKNNDGPNYKWNYINEDGQTLLSRNVFNIKDFGLGYGKFAIKGYGWNLVTPDGKIVFDKYFRDVYPAYGKRGQFIVELGTDTYDVLREDGTSLTPNQKYMHVRSQMEYNGYIVKIKGTNGGKNDYIFSNDLRKNEERDLYYLKADGTLCYMYDVYHEPRPIPQEELDRMGIKIQQPPQEPNTNDYLKDRYELRQGNLQESKNKKVYFTESQIKDIKQRLLQARKETNTNPTEKQKEAGNYKMGRVNILGFDIAIENPKGSYRRGKDRDGKEWKTLMHNDYGYFTHTLAIDGDAVDVFLGDNFECKSIFAIDQKVNGKFDETKVMLGFNSEEEAKNAYLSNYEKDWKGFWRITEVTIDLFKKWLYNGYQQRKPFSEYVEIKKKKLNESNSKRLLTENFDDYYTENDVMSICNDFVEDMKSGRSTQNWRPLINPAMYQKALQVFTKQGNLEGFPEKYVYQWIGILMRNTCKLDSNTELAGHSMGVDYDGIENSSIPEYIREKLNMEVIEWGDDCVVTVTPEYIVSQLNGNYLSKAEKEHVENFKKSMNINEDAVHTMGPNKGQMAMFLSQPELDNYDYQQQIRMRDNNIQGIIDIFNYHNSGEGETRATMLSYGIVASLGENGMINLKMDIFKLLDLIGLYDWMQMPDGSDAWSDFGLRPLFEILGEFDDNTTTPEQALVLVNKALDVSHQRGDMPSIFIEGGSNTLWKITNSGYVNEAFNHWVQNWEIEQIKKFAVDGKIKLYHNTTTDNLEYIVSSGELDAHQHHSEGHGDWLWFSVRPDRWENKCKISIEVPVKEFLEDKKFRFMNANDVITEDNISIYDYNFNIEKVDGLEGERIIEILTGNDERLINYLLSKFFDDISCIKSWFLQRID